MRGLYYADWFEDYTFQLALAVHERAHEVTVVVRDSDVQYRGTRAEAEAQRVRVGDSINRLIVLPGQYRSFKAYREVNRWFLGGHRSQFDYFHIQQSGDPRFLRIASRIPTVLTLHEPAARQGVTRPGHQDLPNAVVRQIYRRLADVIIVHTQSCLMGLSPSERRKAVVIPKGIEARVPPAPPPPERPKTILFFGRAAKYKGLDTLIAAMDEVWKVEPQALLRILASPGDPECEFGIQDSRVLATWRGYSNAELDEALANAHAVCLPYTSVSGTAVGVQAHGAGRPIVTTDLDGLRELAADKELVVQPGNVQDLARAIILVLNRNYEPPGIPPNRTMSSITDAHVKVYSSLTGSSRVGLCR